MDRMVLDRIRAWLSAEKVPFREAHHEPTRTSEESARARGEEKRVGGKALVIKVDDTFRLFVLSADRKLDSAAIKRHYGAKRTRFATPEELMMMTGLVPGSVPPFGEPILPFPLSVDPSVFTNDRVAFNAGSLTDSMVIPIDDYRRIIKPEVFPFSTE
ncbi:MAG TPA: YbaK/EbsC family protein [Bryobacteraceae bacterium]|nr:YbaK/EbsC family protein [Bryobacteraceae bacterium]